MTSRPEGGWKAQRAGPKGYGAAWPSARQPAPRPAMAFRQERPGVTWPPGRAHRRPVGPQTRRPVSGLRGRGSPGPSPSSSVWRGDGWSVMPCDLSAGRVLALLGRRRDPWASDARAAWDESASHGYQALRRALDNSGVEPLDTEALEWGGTPRIALEARGGPPGFPCRSPSSPPRVPASERPHPPPRARNPGGPAHLRDNRPSSRGGEQAHVEADGAARRVRW